MKLCSDCAYLNDTKDRCLHKNARIHVRIDFITGKITYRNQLIESFRSGDRLTAFVHKECGISGRYYKPTPESQIVRTILGRYHE